MICECNDDSTVYYKSYNVLLYRLLRLSPNKKKVKTAHEAFKGVYRAHDHLEGHN